MANSVYIAPAAVFLLYLFKNNKLQYMTYILAICIEIFINSMLKNFYSQPRPYMVEQDIDAYKLNYQDYLWVWIWQAFWPFLSCRVHAVFTALCVW